MPITPLILIGVPTVIYNSDDASGEGEVFATPARACRLAWELNITNFGSVTISLQYSVTGDVFTEIGTASASQTNIETDPLASGFLKVVASAGDGQTAVVTVEMTAF